ncbi:DUF4876 domain-containing protein [Larkinella punicea]|uniref:DUF4876 domain-containing protein n=1 Tax=Larkinella punicea TaxID=2315727 RepID=A0A368JD27_9BACT|nr:DUF4876 domain-containing protein [Larkinella punicea]RCR65569.1 DUF4876 domain-containing protein [Larkinella punicea]
MKVLLPVHARSVRSLGEGLFFLLLVLGFTACTKDKDVVEPVQVEVAISYPANYKAKAGAGITVKLESTTGGESFTQTTGGDGKAVFTSVLPGTYNATATQKLSAADAAAVTGLFSQELTLNAAKTSLNINATENKTIALELAGTPAGSLLIKEVYYTGSKTPSGGTYFSDQFVEIYNNSDQVIYLDGLCIADVHGVSGQINPNSAPTDFKTDAAHVYLSSVWRIPGTGQQHPLEPGKSIIIAQDGINHKTDPAGNPSSPVNLANAEWETYNERPDNRDTDSPAVPNLERLYFTGGFDWLVPVFGPGLVIFRTPDFSKLEKAVIPSSPTLEPRIKLPVAQVIDTFEALQDGNSGGFKRIPVAQDAGFVFASGTYTSESFRRKTATTLNGRRILQDLNNSGSDFEKLATPTPRGF